MNAESAPRAAGFADFRIDPDPKFRRGRLTRGGAGRARRSANNASTLSAFSGSGLTAPNSSVTFAAFAFIAGAFMLVPHWFPPTRKLFLIDMSSFRRSRW